MNAAVVWGAATVVPLLVAVLLLGSRPSSGLHRRSVQLAQLALLPALVLTMLPPDENGTVAAAEASWLLLGTSVGLDPVGRALLVVAVVLYAAALTAVGWRRTRRAGPLEAFLLVTFVGNMGVYGAADAVTFYLSFAVMSFAAAGLVLHERTPLAHHAGRVYLALAVLSETAVLGAVLLTVAAGGLHLADAPAAVAESPYTGLIVVLLIIGFGIKTGLVPVHVWLPLAHPAAPPAASAVLSGAMVKAGLVGWVRFLPLGEAALPGLGTVLVVLALLGAVGAALLGLGQRDPKVVLAYSTVSQMGYLGAVVGIALAEPRLAEAAVASAAVYAVHHGLAKGALFLGVPVWKHHRADRARWMVMGGLALACLAVVGAPFTSGALGKYATKRAVEGVALGALDPVHLLPFVATGSTVLLVRFLWLLVHTSADPLPAGHDPELGAWIAIVLTSLALPWWVAAAWLPVTAVPGLDPVTVWGATWPVLLGLVMSAGGLVLAGARLRARVQQVPAGDLLVLEEQALRRVGQAGRRTWQPVTAARIRATKAVLSGLRGLAAPAGRALDPVVAMLESYRGSGVIMLLLLVVLVLVQQGRP